MKITTLIDNYARGYKLKGEHGLSLYLEISGGSRPTKILFDTGQSDLFYYNAVELGVDLSTVDHLVISHGHYDHTGGVSKFLEVNNRAPIWIAPQAFQKKYNNRKYIGIPEGLILPKERVFYPTQSATPMGASLTQLSDRLLIISTPSYQLPGNLNFSVKEGDNFLPDLFYDELYLAYIREEGVTLISGCSHKGVLEIVTGGELLLQKPVTEFIGGLHTSSLPSKEVEVLAKQLMKTNLKRIWTGHCTGIDSYAILKEYLGERLYYNHTGLYFATYTE